jgi:hypothetical protein
MTQRMISDTDIVEIREVSGFVPSVPGAGVPDHVAFRAQDADAIRSMRLSLKSTDRRRFTTVSISCRSMYAIRPASLWNTRPMGRG